MSLIKPTRLAKAASYFNVAREEIVQYLTEKGFSIADNPNAKIEDDMFVVLNEKYSSEHDLKEESAQFLSQHNKPREEKLISATLKIENIEEKEILAPENETNDKLDPNTPIISEETMDKVEIEKPTIKLKILDKIDIENLGNKKPKKTLTKTEKIIPTEEEKEVEENTVEKRPRKPKISENKSEELSNINNAAAAPKEDPSLEEEDESVEHIETRFQKIEGLKQLGKVDLQSLAAEKKDKPKKEKKEEPPKRPIVEKVKTEDDIDAKKKRSRINETSPEKQRVVIGSEPDKAKFFFDKKKKKDKFEKETVTDGPKRPEKQAQVQVPKNLRQKLRKKKRDDHAEKAQQLADFENDGKLRITEFITVSELASLMNKQPTELITFCFGMGLVVSINQRLDAEIIELLASEYDYEVEFISVEDSTEIEEEEDNPEDLTSRAPIITIMGHVDHGKTSLLDYIRNANVANKEAGGITQHIGAYDVKVPKHDRKITFIDTPGHEAFTAMRARGAKLTDVAIIVVAADDKVMPQTREAISHAQSANVPMIFAINKIDKPGANPEGVRTQLSEMNILVESWGGKFQDQEISAKSGLGIEELLEKILLEADMLELKANAKKLSTGTVIEASLDKGRGYVATVLVLSGTLNIGDFLVVGSNYGKIKAMYDHTGTKVTKVYPGEPVQILGLNGAPSAGETFREFTDEQEAKNIAYKRSQLEREQGIRTKKHITLDEIGRRLALGTFKELNIIIKGDVDGSVQALSDSLTKLSTPEVQVNILHKAVGAITESDVLLASASDAIIIGFQVRPSAQAKAIAERESIDIRHYSVIYQAIDEIKAAMEGMLEPTVEEKVTGNIEIKEIFKITKIGTIAGCYVTDGKVTKTSKVRIIREGIVVHSGKLASLKRFKDDVKEVIHGQDCGLNIDNFNDIQVGDIIEAYEEIEIKRKLTVN
jgi:translation initiation factor IF-2